MRVFPGRANIRTLSVPPGETVQGLITKLDRSGHVHFAEPDFLIRLAGREPNDPRFSDGTLWALHNTGQNGGLADADIDAPEGWDLAISATNLIVAVVDTGVRYTHEDLAANMWVNPQDGSRGFNALNQHNDPNDDSGHGTRIAGILGALGNNGTGVVGVAWQAHIMACRFADHSGGSISDAIACIDYARTNGARTINASWGTYEYSLALSNAIYEAREADIVVVAAAGNDALDTDAIPYYPASFGLDNVLAVAATTRNDELYSFSNRGAVTVDLAAPGLDVYSTDAIADDAYALDHGTSMAAAYVSGVCALLRARFPAESAQQIVHRVLVSTDPLPSLAGRCVTGGRLNLRKALDSLNAFPAHLAVISTAAQGSFQVLLSGCADRGYVLEATTNLLHWFPMYTNVTALDGTLLFTNLQTTNWPQRFFRARSVP